MHKQALKTAIRCLRRYSVPSRSTEKVILHTLEGLDTPRSLAVWLLYKYKEHKQLVDLEVNPLHYLGDRKGARKFRDDYLATELLSKAEFLELDLDRKEVALSKFRLAELRNRETNNRLKHLSFHNGFCGKNVWLLNAATRKIDAILGEFDPVEWVELCSWGPGATYHRGGLDTSPVNKFQNESGITRDLYYLVRDLMPAYSPLWASMLDGRYELVPGNKVTTVPKNAKTDRVIAIEPGLNVFFQLGLGKMISRRLLRSEGIDLKTQERNGMLAFFASMSGSLATVDFSSASDLISIECVRRLLPPRWFDVLDICRSKFGKVDGEFQRMEKFSSMGNGFTFPLQSLIFLAVALSCCEYVGVPSEKVGVFGDDVVIPVEAYQTFQEFCEFLGFSINAEKSFSSGVFRESCGTHYFWGVDVKPIYLKKGLSNAESVYRLANAIRRLAHRRNSHYGCDARLRKAWLFLYGLVPKELRFSIGEGFGDGGFVDNFDSACPSVYRPRRAGNWVEGYFVPAIFSRAVKRASDGLGLLLARLFYPSEEENGNKYPLRTAVNKYIADLFIPRWYDLGPWH